jgi:transcriptional regulator with XRE-family HTH domain
MYITKEELDKRLNRPEVSIVKKVRKERDSVERGKPEDRLTHNDRVLIGVLGGDLGKDETQKDVADLMGVSAQTVSIVARGIRAPSQGVDKELKADIESSREALAADKLQRDKEIQDQLVTNLAAALGQVANGLDKTDAPEASKIAMDMSKILDRVSGNREDRKGNRTAIIINVPQMKEEKHYQTLTV